jgi:hypothetical protein
VATGFYSWAAIHWPRLLAPDERAARAGKG